MSEETPAHAVEFDEGLIDPSMALAEPSEAQAPQVPEEEEVEAEVPMEPEDPEEPEEGEDAEEGQGDEEEVEEPAGAETEKEFDLRKELERLAAENAALKSQVDNKNDAVDLSIKPQEFVTDEQFEEALQDAGAFNKLLNQVYEGAVKRGKEIALAEALPATRQEMQQALYMQSKAQEFYMQNSDLIGHKSYVAKIAEAVQQKHPDWGIEKIYSETAQQARKALNLTQGAADKPPKATPATPKRTPGHAPRSVRKPAPAKPNVSETEADIQAVLNL